MFDGSQLKTDTSAAVALHFPSASCFLLSPPPSLVHSLLFKALSPVCFHLHAPPLVSSSSIIFATSCFHLCVAMVSVILPVDFVFHPFPLPLAVSSSVVFVCAESVVSSSSHPGGARAPPGGRDCRRSARPGPAPTLQHRGDRHDVINPTGTVCHHLAIFAPHCTHAVILQSPANQSSASLSPHDVIRKCPKSLQEGAGTDTTPQ